MFYGVIVFPFLVALLKFSLYAICLLKKQENEVFFFFFDMQEVLILLLVKSNH